MTAERDERATRMSRRTRKVLALIVLVIGLPGYVIVAATVVGMFERPSFALELAVYVGLGVIWVLPLRRIFLGLGRPDPDAGREDGQGRPR